MKTNPRDLADDALAFVDAVLADSRDLELRIAFSNLMPLEQCVEATDEELDLWVWAGREPLVFGRGITHDDCGPQGCGLLDSRLDPPIGNFEPWTDVSIRGDVIKGYTFSTLTAFGTPGKRDKLQQLGYTGDPDATTVDGYMFEPWWRNR